MCCTIHVSVSKPGCDVSSLTNETPMQLCKVEQANSAPVLQILGHKWTFTIVRCSRVTLNVLNPLLMCIDRDGITNRDYILLMEN